MFSGSSKNKDENNFKEQSKEVNKEKIDEGTWNKSFQDQKNKEKNKIDNVERNNNAG